MQHVIIIYRDRSYDQMILMIGKRYIGKLQNREINARTAYMNNLCLLNCTMM